MTTVGEYVKTTAAQAEADSRVRKTLNHWLREGNKLISISKGKKGTLNYGRYVFLLSQEPDPRFKKLFPKAKPSYTVLWGDFGIIARAVSHKIENQHWKFYRQKAAAEKKFSTLARHYTY